MIRVWQNRVRVIRISPNEMGQLNLPIDVLDVSYITVGTNVCVDESIDVVSLRATGIAINEDECAPQDLEGAPRSQGFWKPGMDLYCNEGDNPSDGVVRWPYNDTCPKHIGCTDGRGDPANQVASPCVCGDTTRSASAPPSSPADWPEDPLDEIVRGVEEFVTLANQLLGSAQTSQSIQFTQWYDRLAPYIDPGQRGDTPYVLQGVAGGDTDVEVPCFEQLQSDSNIRCQEEKGELYLWRDTIKHMRDNLIHLREEQTFTDTNAFCLPPNPTPNMSATESALYSSGRWGNLDDIITCLQFQVYGYDYSADVLRTAANPRGNDVVFGDCVQGPNACSFDTCATNPFPRSLIPAFDPNATFTPAAADPALAVDRGKFLNCLLNCNAGCDPHLPPHPTDPILPPAGGPGYSYPDLAVHGTFDAEIECRAENWVSGNVWFDALNNNLQVASGGVGASSCDLSNGTWFRNTFLSWQEAQNQVAKMRVRLDFLEKRRDELDAAIFGLTRSLEQFDNFIVNEVTDLIEVRQSLNDTTESVHHPFHMVYGWQDEPEVEGERGLWHIVKVEARIPERCGLGNCDGDEDGDPPFSQGDVPWPDIDTYRKGFLGSKRCYEMINTSGGVKFRVTRVDENPSENTGEANLPGGLRLWKFQRGAPSRQGIIPDSDWEALDNICPALPNPSAMGSGSLPIYAGAFMLNDRNLRQSGAGNDPSDPNYNPDVTFVNSGDPRTDPTHPLYDPRISPSQNQLCWDKVHEMLSTGVSSEVCAVYYGKEGDRPGFTFDFVPCRLGEDGVF